jgi:outer membrane biosynthesis protein TonB
MRTGLTVSVIAHAVAIGLGLVSLASTEPFEAPVEAVPIDLVKADDVTSLDKGLKTAALKPDPSPNDPAPAPKDEVKPNPAPPKPKPTPTPPPPKPAPPEPPKPAPPDPTPPPPAPDPAPKAAEAPPPDAAPPPEPSPDAAPVEEPKKVAMTPPQPRLRPEPPKAKPEPPKETAQAKPKATPPQKTADAKDSFDTDKIAALLDKTPTASAPAESHSDASLGVQNGEADAKMTQNELDALRAAVQRCWNIPQGWTDPREVTVTVRFALNRDGTVNGVPVVIEGPASQYGQVAADNAVRAVIQCGPYQLPPQKYDQWSEVQLRFTPLG